VVEVGSQHFNTTVLDYLREHLHRTGTKEGCAEGDCGACVVLIGELNTDGTAIAYAGVNSCLQLVPTLDGKSVKTVESLQRANGQLHPVQQAMAESHGTQCGFCTPGIVMSLTGLLQTVSRPTRTQINDALSGNLCRCTGYKPIIDATLKASVAPTEQLRLDDRADLKLLQQLRLASEQAAVLQSEQGRTFFAPKSVAALADYLLQHPQATLLAGSTEIGLQVNKNFAHPQDIVYLGQVSELRTIEDDAKRWRIGAQVSLTTVLELVNDAYPDFAEVLRRFGSPPIRSTATLAGNIANGSPIGDSMPCLLALGATLLLRRGEATRTLDLSEFYTGQKKNALQSGEFIEAIDLPKPSPGKVFRAHKVSKRFEQDISATCCAMTYQLVDGKFTQVRLAYNGLAPSPCRAPKLEALIEGRTPDEVSASELDQAITASFTARDGLRASWQYRSLLARNLVLQFVEEATTPAMETAQ
ncbi:MAG: xanthine dehydrogenase small subunit, partial [Comamonadaceae bacterium]